jgi:hypothetical protein
MPLYSQGTLIANKIMDPIEYTRKYVGLPYLLLGYVVRRI